MKLIAIEKGLIETSILWIWNFVPFFMIEIDILLINELHFIVKF